MLHIFCTLTTRKYRALHSNAEFKMRRLASLLLQHGVALSVEHEVVQANDIRVGECEVEIFEDFGKVEAGNIVDQVPTIRSIDISDFSVRD